MNNKNLFWYLANVDLFQGLNAADLRAVAHLAQEQQCHKNQLLYTPHNSPQDIYIVKEGEVTLYTSKGGKKLVLEVLGPNSIFGALANGEAVDHFAEVTEPAYICVIPLQKFTEFIAEKPYILLNLLKILSSQVKDYREKLKENLLSAEEKVLGCLAQQEKRNDSLWGAWIPLKKPTHAKIAEQTGLSRETVSRIISRLKKEGKL